MSTLAVSLLDAAKTYGKCAKAVNNKLTSPASPNTTESTRLIGFGIAADWSKRAATLRRLKYSKPGGPSNKSRRGSGVTELIRFNMAWYAMNALFSRKAILDLLGGSTPSSELSKFRFLFDHAGLSKQRVATLTGSLHTILGAPHTTRVPGFAAGSPIGVLEGIMHKYIPAEALNYKNGVLIRSALSSGNLTTLDLPTLIYLMRNWIVHGAMMDGAFGGIVRFESYIEKIGRAHV